MAFKLHKAGEATFSAVALELWSSLPPVHSFLEDAQAALMANAEGDPPPPMTPVPPGAKDASPSVALEIPSLPGPAERCALRVPRADVVELLIRLHRASFANALESDSVRAVEEVTIEMRLGAGTAEGGVGNESLVEFESFKAILKGLLLTTRWADSRCLSTASVAPHGLDGGVAGGGASAAAAAATALAAVHPAVARARATCAGNAAAASLLAVSTVVENYLCDYLECVLTDESPLSRMRDLANVWTRREFPLVVEQPISLFTRLAPHLDLPEMYRELWIAATGRSSSISGEDKFFVDEDAEMSLEEFTRAFHFLYRHLFTNATLERSRVAAADLWEEAGFTTEGDVMHPYDFKRALVLFFHSYARRCDSAKIIKEIIEAAKRALLTPLTDSTDTRWIEAERAEGELLSFGNDPVLSDPQAFSERNEIEEDAMEQHVYETPTTNRILCLGDTVATSARTLASVMRERLQLAPTCVETLVLAAVRNEKDEFHVALNECLLNKTAIPLSLQASLLRRELQKPITRHLGYVISDVPVEAGAEAAHAFLEMIGLRDYPPRGVVQVDFPFEFSAPLHEEAVIKLKNEYEKRVAHHAVLMKKAEKNSALTEAGEGGGEATDGADREQQEGAEGEGVEAIADDEEKTTVAEPAEAVVSEEAGYEEEDDQDPEAEELSPEEIAEREAARLAAAKEALLLASVRYLIQEGKNLAAAASSSSSSFMKFDCASEPQLQSAFRSCDRRGRLVRIGSIGDVMETVNYLIERLQLAPSTRPQRPELSAEALESLPEGANSPNPSPDVENVLIEAWQAAVEEQPEKFKPSVFRRFCPVTFVNDHVLVEGLPAYLCCYRGKTYYMASKAKFQLFCENPHKYLARPAAAGAPILLLQAAKDTFATVGSDAPSEHCSFSFLVVELARRLGLTLLSLAEYHAQWVAQRAAVAARVVEAAARAKADAQGRAEAAERSRQRAEKLKPKKKESAKGGQKKKGGKEVKTAVIKTESNVEVEAEEPEDDQDEAGERDGEGNAVPAVDLEVQAKIDTAKRVISFGAQPQLVSVIARDFDGRMLEDLLEWGALPSSVVLLEAKIPKKKDVLAAEEDEEQENEGGEEEEGDEDVNEENLSDPTQAQPDDTAETEQQSTGDETGEPARPPPPDLRNPRAYKRWMTSFVKKLSDLAAPEGGEAPPPLFPSEAPVTEPDGSLKNPRQMIGLMRLNIYDTSPLNIAAAVAQRFGGLGYPVRPGDPDRISAEADEEGGAGEEEGDEDSSLRNDGLGKINDPLLRPGPTSTHALGLAGRFCCVSLYERGVLEPGDPQLCLEYRSKQYTFSNERSMDLFLVNPEKYLTPLVLRSDGALGPAPPPPPRLLLNGVAVAGTRVITELLRERYGIPVYEDLSYEYATELIAAANSPNGLHVRGLFIPMQNTPGVRAAAEIERALSAFDVKQDSLAKRRAEREAREERRAAAEGDGDDDDEEEEEAVDEELDAFEPEDEEARQQRLKRAHIAIAAALLFGLEPFKSSGFVLVGGSGGAEEWRALRRAGSRFDAVINLKLSSEQFALRSLDKTLVEKEKTREVGRARAAQRRERLQEKQRAAALRQWRRRHIAEDDEAGAEEEEAEEDVEKDEEDGEVEEPISRENVLESLEQEFLQQDEQLTSFAAAAEEDRTPLIQLDANVGPEGLRDSFLLVTERQTEHRRSLFEAPMVIHYNDAEELLKTGRASYSAFRLIDPVELFEKRHNKDYYDKFKRRPPPNEHAEAPEESIVEEKGQDGLSTNPGISRSQKDGAESANNDEDAGEEEGDERASEGGEPQSPVFVDEPEPEVDPEELEEMRQEQQRKDRKAEQRYRPKVALFHNRLYYFTDNKTLLLFMKNPLKYWDQAAPLPQCNGPIVNVVEVAAKSSGAGEDGTATSDRDELAEGGKKTNNGEAGVMFESDALKRSLAAHLAETTGAVYLTVPKVLKWAASLWYPLPEHARQELRDILFNSNPIPPSFFTSLLAARLLSGDVQSRGAVLDNVLRSPADVEALQVGERVAVSLALSFAEKGVKDPLTEFIHDYSHIDVRVPSISPSSFESLVLSKKEVERCKFMTGVAMLSRRWGFPLALDGTAASEAYIAERLSKQFQNCCPHMWIKGGELINTVGGDASGRCKGRFVAEFLNKTYTLCCKEHLSLFLAHPEEYVSAVGQDTSVVDEKAEGVPQEGIEPLPELLPSAIDALPPNESAQLCGCCPVTLFDTRFKVGLCGLLEPVAVRGSFWAEYEGKYYAMCSEEHLSRFLRQPWLFARNAVLPKPSKIPPYKEGKGGSEEPESEEQYIVKNLYEPCAKALVDVAEKRPRYPGLSVEASALKYIALHLKAKNKEENTDMEAEQYKTNFEIFKKRSLLYKGTTKKSAAADKNKTGEYNDEWDEAMKPNSFENLAKIKRTIKDPEIDGRNAAKEQVASA